MELTLIKINKSHNKQGWLDSQINTFKFRIGKNTETNNFENH